METNLSHRPALLHLLSTIILLTVLVGPSLYAQTEKNIVFWSDQPECGSKKVAAENTLKYVCSAAKVTSGTVRIVETDEFRIRILPVYFKETVSIRTIIENKSKKKIGSDYTKWSIAHYGSEADFLSGKPPIANERYLNPIPQSIASSTAASDPFGSAPTRMIKKVGNPNDPKNPIRVPEGQQQMVVLPTTGNVGTSLTPSRGKTDVKNVGEFIFIIKLLDDRSVDENAAINGTVPFNRHRNAPFKLAFVHVGETTFVFSIW